MKRIIITGASGLVATELTIRLLAETDARLFLLSTNPEKVKERYINNLGRVSCFTLESFTQFVEDNKGSCHFDACIHTAFSRSSNGNQIAASLDYQQQLLRILKKTDLKVFTNISSQSVYGKLSEPLWTETTPVDPDYLYAMGKYSSEIITKLMLEDTNIKWTNIRLASVAQNANFIKTFIRNTIEGSPIYLTAPYQTCSFIDIRDVASALFAFISNIDNVSEHVYNLGVNMELSISDIAKIIINVGCVSFDLKKTELIIKDDTIHARVAMDSSLFEKTFHWRYQYDMSDMIKSVFCLLLSK